MVLYRPDADGDEVIGSATITLAPTRVDDMRHDDVGHRLGGTAIGHLDQDVVLTR